MLLQSWWQVIAIILTINSKIPQINDFSVNGIAGAAVPADLDAKIASVTMSAGAAVEQGFKRFMQMPAMANILKPETVNGINTVFSKNYFNNTYSTL